MTRFLQSLSDEQGRRAFGAHLKPYVARVLQSIGLDVVYERGEGDYLYFKDDQGREQRVLDLLGGYGAALFGHNHPDLIECAMEVLQAGRPFVAQASSRSYAGLLAERLAALAKHSTGHEYVVTLGNSGTEAVEAAIKHAELEAAENIQAIFSRLKQRCVAIRLGLSNSTVRVPEALFREAEEALGATEIAGLDALEFHLLKRAEQVLLGESRLLAMKGAFHGKTTGSLKLTYNPEFRNPWQRIGLQVHFLPRNDLETLQREVEEGRTHYFELQIAADGTVQVVRNRWSRITACFVEPILGEGGIQELSPGYLQALRRAADAEGFPLVIDEIQSGMGRTGSFLASEAGEIAGDYYVLSKALGGGLAKLSALLVRRERSLEVFGYLHSSTFADDDFSSAIGLRVLELLQRDGGALVRGCREKGDYLLSRLRELQVRYPQVIKEVRGRGLMIGIELASLPGDFPSPFLRIASDQNLLGFLLCGYLLHEERIRIAPTLSEHGTIRLEPSAYITESELERFCASLERAITVIASGDTAKFTRFLSGQAIPRPGGPVECSVPSKRQTLRTEDAAPTTALSGGLSRKVAFLGHFLEPLDLLHWDPSLGSLSDAECSQLLDRTHELMEPFIVQEGVVRSALGGAVGVTVIGIPFTAQQIMNRMRGGALGPVTEKIRQAVAVAKRLGCSVLGFGGYTSIVTNNCLDVVEDQLALTSGNSLTAAAAIAATRSAAREMGIDPASARLGIVGGLGNIGRVLAEIEADEVAAILLVGRPGARLRLEQLAEELYLRAWEQVQTGHPLQGIARAMSETKTLRRLRAAATGGRASGVELRCGLHDELGARAPIQITTDLGDLVACNLIISASNSPQPVLHPEHVGLGPTVICDVAVPTDVHPHVVRERPQTRLIKGGVVTFPSGQNFQVGGMRLPDGQSYACLAESILLGLAGVGTHFSYGPLRPAPVRQILQLATDHGFAFLAREGHNSSRSFLDDLGGSNAP